MWEIVVAMKPPDTLPKQTCNGMFSIGSGQAGDNDMQQYIVCRIIVQGPMQMIAQQSRKYATNTPNMMPTYMPPSSWRGIVVSFKSAPAETDVRWMLEVLLLFDMSHSEVELKWMAGHKQVRHFYPSNIFIKKKKKKLLTNRQEWPKDDCCCFLCF